jgi:hypothetical protein
MDRKMGTQARGRNRAGLVGLTAVVVGMAALLAAKPAPAHWGSPGLATIEVHDRADGTVLPVYEHEGRRYVVGTPGHEYTLRVINRTGARILAVTSVDGVNVVSGETASPEQSGYVIDAWGSVEIGGWRKSLSRTAAFYFTDLGDSYAARTGRPGNVGVIGVAVFRERPRPVVYVPPRDNIARADSAASAARRGQAEAQPPAAGAPGAWDSTDGSTANGAAREPMPAAPVQPSRDGALGRLEQSAPKAMAAAPLGTGHGRDETSFATRVAFERASTTPAEIVSVQYDRRETLAALGILPQPQPRYARRSPDAFPASMRFVPDPR